MLKNILKAALTLAFILVFPFSGHAQLQAPVLEFHTQLYDMYGTEHSFYFQLGATEETYVEVDFGYGAVEYKVGNAILNSESGAVEGTIIRGSVGSEGIVRVYGDPLKIDYLDIWGVYADRLDASKLLNLDILDVRHNMLQELDLSGLKHLTAIYLDDNPFDVKPLLIGADHPDLTIISMMSVGHLDQSFSPSDYPRLKTLQAFHTFDLRVCDTTNNPELLQLSIDATNVENLDLSNNPELVILNIGGTKITELDLSHNLKIQQLYCPNGGLNREYKLKSMDLSRLTQLRTFFGSDNLFTELDVTNCPELSYLSLQNNYLPGIDLSGNPDLYSVDIAGNCMDFVTLPADRPSFGEYYYRQRAIGIDRSFPVGGQLDLGSKLNRPGSVTTAKLMRGNEDLGSEYITYDNGIVKFLKEIPDSVSLAFHNSDFEAYGLNSTNFVVKNEADYGKDNAIVSWQLRPSTPGVSLRIGIAGATPENPKQFSVDFGDGNPVSYVTETDQLPELPIVVADKRDVGNMTLYIPENEDLTAFGMEDSPLVALDVTKAHSLVYLSVEGCSLVEINLIDNHRLRSLDLDRNSLEILDLTGRDSAHEKTMLRSVSADDNRLKSYIPAPLGQAGYLSLANNRLEEVDLTDCNNLEYLDVSGNQLSEIDLYYCEALQRLDISDNEFYSLSIPEYTPLTALNLSNNRFPLSDLADLGTIDNFVYAPQKSWRVPAKAPCVDLSKQVLENGRPATVFKWYAVDSGMELTDSQIYSEGDGKFRFLDASVGEVYATWTNPLFPDFNGDDIYRSGHVLASAPPTREIASFRTKAAGETYIVMGSTIPDNYVYIDWEGNGQIVQYELSDKGYRGFTAKTYPDAEVKIYSYEEENDGVAGISIRNTPMYEIDLSSMTDAYYVIIPNSELSTENIKLPATQLSELDLSGNQISDMDLSVYTSLRSLSVMDCGLNEFDATPFTNLGNLSISNNKLERLTLNNPFLWNLFAQVCELESIDFSNVPRMAQIWLDGNHLSALDLSDLPLLKVISLNNNLFTLTTLPRVLSTYSIYEYSYQAPYPVTLVDGHIIDLSSQMMVGTNRTSYRWFRDLNVGYLDDGTIVGDELIEGVDYTQDEGVFDFAGMVNNAVCVMTNQAFPNLVYLSEPIDIQGSGVESVADKSGFGVKSVNGAIIVIGAQGPVHLFAPDGRIVGRVVAADGVCSFDSVEAGIYIVSDAMNSAKVVVR